MTPLEPTRAPLPDEPFLKELIREAERALDYQVRAFERADGRAEQMLGLAAGALVGGWGAASAALGNASGPPPPVFILLIGAGSLCTFISLGRLVRAYMGLRERSAVRVGPSPGWLLAEALGPAPALESHRREALRLHADNHAENLAGLFRAEKARAVAVRWLLAGILLFGSGFLYIAGR